MHLSQISVNRPVAVAMFYLGVVLIGVISLSRLSVDLLPDLSYPKLTIWTSYQDVGPLEVEELVTKPIEEAVGTVPGIRKTSSISREGLSLVTVEFLWGTEMDFATLNVREKLDNLRWILPREAGRPTIIRIDPRSQPIMTLSVSGGDLIQLKELARDVVKRRLEQIKGVALAAVTGGLEREIQVEVDERTLTALSLTMEHVSTALASANYNLPGGTIKKGRYRYALRTLGEFQDVSEINNVVVGRGRNGSLVYLKDVASVVDGFRERESITRFNGQESIGLIIKKEAGANTVQVSKLVRQVLQELKEEYPEVTIAVAYDQARFISNAISNVIQNIILGGLLAFLVLFFFLHDFRSPFNIALSMPISVIATFSLLYFTDVSLNIMSLGGLALGVGMLVDNSIVVLENIFRHRQEGRGHLEAAVDGTREVAMPVLASTLTTIAVFLPVVYVYGVAGQLFRDQALTVTFSLLASLLVALTLLPMLTCHFVFRGPVKSSLYLGTEETLSFSSKPGFWHKTPWRWLLFPFRWIVKGLRKALTFLGLLFRELFRYWLRGLTSAAYRVFNPIFRISDIWLVHIAGLYEKTLLKALNNRLVVIGLISGVMALAILLTPLLDRELMPQVDQGEFAIKVKMPLGSSLEATAATVAELEGWLLKQEDVTAVFSTIGIIEDQTTVFTEESGLNRAQLQVRLKEGRKHSTAEIMALIREQGARLALAEISFETGESVLQQVLGTAEPPVAVKIQGEDLDVCQRIAHQVRQRIKDVPGLKDLHTNLELGRPEYRIEIDREAAGRYGLSVTQLADFIQNTMKGRVATQFKDFDRKIDILVRPTLEQRDELADLLNAHVHVSIPTSGGRASKPSGQAIPLRELIRCTPTLGPSEIRREDQVRQVVLYGNLQGRSLGAVIKDINKGTADVEIPYDYRLIIGGEQEEVRRSFRSLVLALILAVLLIYMILAAQFESLRHPFVILLDVPITASCLMLLLFMTGLSVNVITLIGLIVLAGIAVNDSIIKVDFINQRRREGMPMREAILDAGQKRLRPILMTSVTTILGLLPMAIGLGEGAELQRPLAVTLIGGLFFSTMVTLFAVPVVYSYLERK